jgi:sialidase-1
MVRPVLLLSSSVLVLSQLSDECQKALDDFCAQDCFPKIASRPCDGPMYARHSGPSSESWRCYSPSTLQDNSTYGSGSCYCSRDSQLSGILADCQSGLTSTRVFNNGDLDACYRIPAVVQTKSGALVAFAESRHGGCGDSQVKEIAVSTSKDNGKTWSPVSHAVTAPTDNGNVGNPMPFALSDGRVALTYVYRNDGGAGVGSGDAMVFSEDDGMSWSQPRDITEGFGEAKGSMPGPGAGIQLESGRLLLISHFGAYVDDYVTYSDDQGETWSTVAQKFPKMDEATMADLGGGEVLLNFRHLAEGSRGRGVARSSDGGLTWTDISYDSALKGPVCQGSLAAFGGHVYFSNPDSTSGRNHLTVKRSDDGGHSWTASYLIQAESSAGYSSLVQGTVGSDEKGGILFESSSNGCIDFKTFPLSMSSEILV